LYYMVKLSKKNNSTFVYYHVGLPEFIAAKKLPPGNSDISPVDFSLWGALQQKKLCHGEHRTLFLNPLKGGSKTQRV